MTIRQTLPALATAVALCLPTFAAAQDTPIAETPSADAPATEAPATDTPVAEAPAGEAPDAETVVATVNGTDITLGHMIVLKQRLPEQYRQLPPNILFDGILDQLVQQTLLGQEVEQLSPGSQLTIDIEMRALRANEELSRLSQSAVTDEALQAAYDASYGSAEPGTEYNASHILVATEDEAKALVEEINGGADFAELAKTKSTGPSGPRGGELGWFGEGAMVEPFEVAVKAMEPGSVSAPVQTQFGWHVIKLNETRQATAPALDDVRTELMDQVQRSAIEARIEELTSAADVTRKSSADIDPAVLDDLSLLGE